MSKINHVLKDTIVYKGAYTSKNAPCLVTLKLTKGTKINYSIKYCTKYSTKNRAEKAKVIKINRIAEDTWCYGYARKETIKGIVHSQRDPEFKYKVGDTIKPKFSFDYSKEECSSGIHFYMTKQQAINFIVRL